MVSWRGLALLALVAGLGACDDGGAGGSVFDGFPPPPDAAPDAGPDAALCPPGEYRGADGCAPLPPDVCGLVDAITADCQDRDGDCFVVGCTQAPAELADCDDTRADVAPGAPERCDGVDNDCDDVVDESLGLGDACDVCGPGHLECAVAIPGGVACSTAVGQSEAAAGAPEQCNGRDDDCDDVVDEACAIEAPTADRRMPALCGDAVVLVEDGRLIRRPLDGEAEEELAPAPAAYPACDAGVVAWLVPDAPCEAPPGGPLRCPRARLLARGPDEITREITGLADLGPPRVDAGRVYWHAALGTGPVLQRQALDGEPEPLLAGAAASDPSAVVAGRVAVRRWEGEEAQVEVHGLDGEPGVRVGAAPGAAGPPALDEAWGAWIVDAAPPAVWAVPLARPRDGFQVATGGPPVGRPWLDGGRLIWQEADGLRGLTLATGAPIWLPGPTADVDVRDGRVAWVAAGRLYLAQLEGGAPPVGPGPDAGPDAGPALDAGLDVGVDARPDGGPDGGPDATP
ncbi:MAG: hypothetical protein H6706_11025 [Myxococcales bacterium]|nr:hypothetical protein [Myxococcales bacterium]